VSRVDEALDAIRAVDSGTQLDDVLALPDHLPDALWRVESARIEPMQSNGLIVCGMGGSGAGGLLARAVLGDRLSLPLTSVRDYEFAPWASPERVVLCASYSGNTEETLACFDAAEAVGCTRIAATTGGALAEAARAAGVPVIPFPAALQPRAAVGYLFVVAAEVAALAGAAIAIRTEIDAAAQTLAEARDSLVERSVDLADAIAGTIPVIYGNDLTRPIAYRWKTEVNENAKQPAFWNEMPEMGHNEIAGWATGSGSERFSAIFLLDSDQHPRQRSRMELTAELIAGDVGHVELVEIEGESRTARMLQALMLGDLVSLHLAVRRGVDPTPITAIDKLKERLGSPN
jgi:glucose/mannose-6-phosphate isomerase